MLKDVFENGITENEITLVKQFIRGRMNINMEDNDVKSIYNGEQVLLYPNEKFVSYENIFETYYKNITKLNLNEIIRKYFIKSNMVVCIIGENLPSENIIHRECEKW